jgi:hypothetical protein
MAVAAAVASPEHRSDPLQHGPGTCTLSVEARQSHECFKQGSGNRLRNGLNMPVRSERLLTTTTNPTRASPNLDEAFRPLHIRVSLLQQVDRAKQSELFCFLFFRHSPLPSTPAYLESRTD